MIIFNRLFRFLAIAGLATQISSAQESIKPLKDGKSPQTLDEVWMDYDPSAEPLEVEVHKEWEENGVVLRAVRYCVGTFKGKKSYMAAYYGFPKGGKNLPGLLQVHGGGGMASKKVCVENALRGYATISINWRADKRFLKETGLGEEAQTDWGAVAGAQTRESRGIEPNNDQKYDSVSSARNNGYFLRTIAARRALTFLQKQPEVNPDKLGNYGHSMGGVITLRTAAMDPRIKATAPSCGPPILKDDTLLALTGNGAYPAKLNCPTLFMNPIQDFHGPVDDVEWIIDRMGTKNFRIARSEHLNHKHNNSSLTANYLWFDAHLKKTFTYPQQPQVKIDLKSSDARPTFTIKPDQNLAIERVDIFYTTDGKYTEYPLMKTRYWRFAEAAKSGDVYSGKLDLFKTDEPLWVFANVHYKLPEPAESYHLPYTADTLNVSTRMLMIPAKELKEVKPTLKESLVIESFGENWQNEWVFSHGGYETWKLNDPRIMTPKYAKLILKLKSQKAGTLRIALANYNGVFKIKGGGQEESIEIYPFEFINKETKARLLSWDDLRRPNLVLRPNTAVEYKQLAWEAISQEEHQSRRPFQVGEAPQSNGSTMLSLTMADKIVGRFDTENKTVKSTFKEGLQVHSISKVDYFLKGQFKRFKATLVPHHQASVSFEIYADGKKVFETGLFTGKSKAQEIDVDVSKVQKLELHVTDGGNGWGGDWVMWANARIE